MSLDLEKIKKARLFKKVPERALNKILEQSQIRGFARGEAAIAHQAHGEYAESIGYLVSGVVLFLNADDLPLGFAQKDEFFLARPFTLENQEILRVISGDDSTIVLYVPKATLEHLAEGSPLVSKKMKDIFEAILARSRVAGETHARHVQLLREIKENKLDENSVQNWVDYLEKKRAPVEDAKSQSVKESGGLLRRILKKFRRPRPL